MGTEQIPRAPDRTLLLLDIDGVVCPYRVREATLPMRKVIDFPATIGGVYAYEGVVDAIRFLPCRKVWLSSWEDHVTPEMMEAFGIHEFLQAGRWSREDHWTDWWKADALIDYVEPRASFEIDRVIWIDDELGSAQNAEAVRTVLEVLQGWAVNVQLINPWREDGLQSEDLGLLSSLVGEAEQ